MSEAGLKADGRLQGRIYSWKSVISPSRDRNQYPPHFFWTQKPKNRFNSPRYLSDPY